MFRSAGNIDGTTSRQAADKSANGGAGVPRRSDIGVVEHGVTKPAHHPVRRGFRLGKDIDQLAAGSRP
jgi:hypothetical protein